MEIEKQCKFLSTCLKLFVFASFRLPVHPYVRVETWRLISLHHYTPDLKIFCLYSEKTRVLTNLHRCTFDLDISFSRMLAILEQEISKYLDSKKKIKKKNIKKIRRYGISCNFSYI